MKKSRGAFSASVVDLVRARDRDGCAWCGSQIYGERGLAWSVHHRKPRGAGGTRDPLIGGAANALLTHGHGTWSCHGEIESERKVSRVYGFLVPRNGVLDPADVPVRHAVHGLVYLDDDGGYTAVQP